MLPLFLDHVFFPVLDDRHFLTEVFCVDGENEDCGVVFCEMQGLERQMTTMLSRRLSQLTYPGTNGYNVETGGLMADLRDTSRSNMSEVRAYHKRYYVPENCFILVCGQDVDADKFLRSLDPIDERLAKKFAGAPKMERPFFSGTLEPLVPKSEVMEFPAEEENSDFGEVDIAWRVPGVLSDALLEKLTALGVLTQYLASGISSPLYAGLVDMAKPFCRSVAFRFNFYRELSFSLELEGVPVAQLEEAPDAAYGVLQDVAKKGIDMKRLEIVLQRMILDETSQLEENPAPIIHSQALLAFLYFKLTDFPKILWGHRERLLSFQRCHAPEYWQQLLQELLLSNPRVVVKAKPSAELHHKYFKEDEAACEERKRVLGEAGLKEAAAKFEAAKAFTGQDVPPAVMDQLVQAIHSSVRDASFHRLSFFRCGTACPSLPSNEATPAWLAAHLHGLERLPFCGLEVAHCSSTAFVDLSIWLNVGRLSAEDLRYLELFSELMFESPLVSEPDYAKVSLQMSNDVLSTSVGTGLTGSSYFRGMFLLYDRKLALFSLVYL